MTAAEDEDWTLEEVREAVGLKRKKKRRTIQKKVDFITVKQVEKKLDKAKQIAFDATHVGHVKVSQGGKRYRFPVWQTRKVEAKLGRGRKWTNVTRFLGGMFQKGKIILTPYTQNKQLAHEIGHGITERKLGRRAYQKLSHVERERLARRYTNRVKFKKVRR